MSMKLSIIYIRAAKLIDNGTATYVRHALDSSVAHAHFCDVMGVDQDSKWWDVGYEREQKVMALLFAHEVTKGQGS